MGTSISCSLTLNAEGNPLITIIGLSAISGNFSFKISKIINPPSFEPAGKVTFTSYTDSTTTAKSLDKCDSTLTVSVVS